MQAEELLDAFGYATSRNFLPSERFEEAIEHVHVLRRTVYACHVHQGKFHGVYSLREDGERSSSTPVVFFAEAQTSQAADEIHRKVWNQNVAPFLLVRLPEGVRLYSGFRYERAKGNRTKASTQGVLETLIAFEDAIAKLAEFRAAAIDSGLLWEVRGKDVDPRKRVDWRLLSNLEHLGKWLRHNGLSREAAHGLIGKFVYLRYLFDREILSPRRLREFDVDPEEVFGRKATLKGVQTLIERVDGWLNGSVFPLSLSGKNAPTSEQLREVAGAFLGDEPGSGQLHLDFAAYDFSYIPIETLSVIYEQFLHAEERGREAGAYYTPIPLVNFMLAELDDYHPLEPSMRVFDPACGSGAFLVQCYRRLIERQVREERRLLRPVELRDILVSSIFGLDRDADACRVTELSLVLTMLDYIDPPDLLRTPSFKLPNLHNANIFEGDFFDEEANWKATLDKGFDWIVGNPPWRQLDPEKLDEINRPTLNWIEKNAKSCPIAGFEVAEAFAWKVADHVNDDGVITLLLPAMSLVKEQDDFRDRFFEARHVFAVANFANLREVLFAGRSRMPAASLFYSGRMPGDQAKVLVYSPLVANQEANRSREDGTRQHTWTILVNRSEIRSLSLKDIVGKGGLPWKLAMWGTVRDKRLLDGLNKRLSSLHALEKAGLLIVSEGLQLRERGSGEAVEPAPNLIGQNALSTEALRRLGRVHSFPHWAIEPIPRSRAFVRSGRLKLPLSVCSPPHVVVSAARNWAVFSNEFLVIPPRQVGIAAAKENENLLRALALYLNSDFVTYHQFFDSSQEGFRDGRSTLASLRRMPIPFEGMSSTELRRWAELHRELVAVASRLSDTSDSTVFSLKLDEPDRDLKRLETQLNSLVGDTLGLTQAERWLVDDLVHVRKQLTDGRLGDEAIGTPATEDLARYGETLKHELDAFLEPSLGLTHRVRVMHATTSGIVHVELIRRDRSKNVVVSPADSAVSGQLRNVEQALGDAHGQWLYFDRNLFLYREEAAYVLKPMQKLWWTRSQALADADELIADALVKQESA